MEFNMHGKTAVVTGGSRGLGKAIARGFYESGANVVICSKNKESLSAALQEFDRQRFKGIQADVSVQSDVENAVSFAVEQFGSLDVMVNNAGIVTLKPAVEYSEEDWEQNWKINVSGVFYGCCAAAKYWIKNEKPGKIINISSIAGLRGAPGVYIGYSTTKAAVANLTRALAVEWAPNKINVNAIAPGRFDTDMNKERHADPVELAKVRKQIPWGRIGQPQEIAPLAVYLAGGYSDFMTGEVIALDGGTMQV